MSKQKATLNQADLDLLENKFATKDDLKKLDKKLDKMFNFFDKDYSKLKKHVINEIDPLLKLNYPSDF